MNNISIKRSIFNFIYVVVIIFGVAMIISGINNIEATSYSTRFVVNIGFLINFIIIITHMSNRYILGYSINDMFWIFNLIFFVVAPFIQYNVGNFPWRDDYMILNTDLLFFTNMVITFFIIIYSFSYKITKLKNKKILCLSVNSKVILIGVVISFFFVVFIIANVGFENLFSRSEYKLDFGDSSLNLIISNTVRMFPVIVLGLQLSYRNVNSMKNYKDPLLWINVLLVLLVNFPTALARNSVAAIYIGLMVIYFPKWKNKYTFKYLILFGLLFIFPLINIFRNNSFSDLAMLTIELPNPAQDFLVGDFDAYSMLARAIYYTSEVGLTMGLQLLGVLLFFIPRTIWPNKPIGSGAMVGEAFGWSFTNVSMPYIGEGYINFGIVGVIGFAIILAIFTKKIELHYIENYNKKINYVTLAYPFLIGYIFFLLRGDLLSSFAFITGGVIVPIILLYMIAFLVKIIK